MATKPDDNTKHEHNFRQESPVQIASDYGIDISMLIDNLNRSVTERIKRHQIALDTAKKIRKAKKRE
jgi:hypothetical protein